MAVEVERLVAVLEAKVSKFEKDFAKAGQTANRELAAVEKRGAQFAANINTAMSGAGRGFDATSRNVVALRGQTANLASQFQDIAVQLQSGTSPLTIALQQGTQINQVLGPLGVRGAVSALGGAFLSLVNPVSLATIGIIAAGGAALQYFSSILSDGEASSETIRKQGDLVRQVAKDWGDAVPALKAYVDELDRAAKIEGLQGAADVQLNAIFAGVRPEIDNIAIGVAELIITMRDLGASEAEIAAVRESFQALDQKTDELTATAEDFKAVQDAVAASMEQYGIPAAINLGNALTGLAQRFLSAAASAAQLRDQSAAALAVAQSQYVPMDDVARGEQNRRKSYDPIETIGVYEAPTRRAGSGGKSEAAREREQAAAAAKREEEAVVALIEALIFEQEQIGRTETEREVANQLRRAGKAATDEQRAGITALVQSMAAEREAIEATKDAMAGLKDLTKGLLDDFFSGIEQGKSVWEAFGDAALNVLNKVTDKLLNDVLDAIFSVNGALAGGGGGGILGLLGGLLGGGLSPLASSSIAGGGVGLYASGGYTGAGGKYTPKGVVHAGEYVFDAQTVKRLGLSNLAALHGMAKSGYANGGFVGGFPSVSMPSKSGGGESYTSVYKIDARGAQQGVGEEIRRALAEYDSKVAPNTARRAVQQGQKYGTMR